MLFYACHKKVSQLIQARHSLTAVALIVEEDGQLGQYLITKTPSRVTLPFMDSHNMLLGRRGTVAGNSNGFL